MKQQILTQFPWPWLPTLALLIFFSFFVFLLFRISSQSQRRVFEAAEQLPLADGDKHE